MNTKIGKKWKIYLKIKRQAARSRRVTCTANIGAADFFETLGEKSRNL
jgi:hypothetical protein